MAKVLLGAVTACGGAHKSNKAPGDDDGMKKVAPGKGEDVAALFEREVDLTAAYQLAHPDGLWRTRVPATAPPSITSKDGFAEVSIPIGTASAVSCYFYEEPIDAGQAVTTMLETMQETIDFTHVTGYRVGAPAGFPVFFLDARYLVDSDEGKLAGSFKLGVSPRFETPVLCFHDEPGYRASFAQVMSGLLGALETQEPENPPTFSEVWAMQVGDIPIGYELFRVFPGDGGKTIGLTLNSSFFPVGTGEISTTDQLTVIKSDATGILTGRYLKFEGRAQMYDLNLERKGPVSYSVKGVYQDKELTEDLTSKEGLSDSVSLYRFLKKNRTATKKLVTTDFSPGIDPSAFTHTEYVIRSDGSMSMKGGNFEATSERDETGLPASMLVPIGTREVVGTLLHRQGDIQ